MLLGAVGGNEFNALPPDRRPEAGLLQLRQALKGFANLRPSFAWKALAGNSPLRPEVTDGADILFVRELLGGLYFGEPRAWDRETGAAWNTMRYTRDEVSRVAHIAFQLAGQRRKKVTSVDKANVLEVSQLWRATVTEIAKQYPGIALDHQYVDACAMHLMNTPRNFDVVLTENLFGDILSDEAAVITGSLGMLPSATIGGTVNLFEPVHGSAPDIAGKGIANPLGAILTAAMILRHSANLEQDAQAVEERSAKYWSRATAPPICCAKGKPVSASPPRKWAASCTRPSTRSSTAARLYTRSRSLKERPQAQRVEGRLKRTSEVA